MGGREAAARLVWAVVRADRGERDDLGHGEAVERLGRIEEVGGGWGSQLRRSSEMKQTEAPSCPDTRCSSGSRHGLVVGEVGGGGRAGG